MYHFGAPEDGFSNSLSDDGELVYKATFADGTSAVVLTSLNVCYPNCDGNGQLDINDFACFQTMYSFGDPSADCDGSGTLDVDDFACFQTMFGFGC